MAKERYCTPAQFHQELGNSVQIVTDTESFSLRGGILEGLIKSISLQTVFFSVFSIMLFLPNYCHPASYLQ